MAVRVLEHPDFGSYDLTSLRSWPLGGAPVSPHLLARIRTALPNLATRGLSNTWGMTEAGGFLTVADGRDLLERPGTVGRPYPVVEVRIDRPGADGVGEVVARSPTVMLGYAGRDDGTVDAEGWLHSGDLGHLDGDGYLYIDGRSKDMVIRGGENIACPQVEGALMSHPAVVEAAVFGIPHADLGEELAAVVVHRDGTEPPAVDALARTSPTRWRRSPCRRRGASPTCRYRRSRARRSTRRRSPPTSAFRGQPDPWISAIFTPAASSSAASPTPPIRRGCGARWRNSSYFWELPNTPASSPS